MSEIKSAKIILPNILVVDDQEDNRELLKTFIETFERVNVIACNSGDSALGVYKDTEFALVLLDVDMPRMDGFELARRMKEMKPNNQSPIIYITGYDINGKRAAIGYELGAVDYILKPFNMDFLLSKVRVFLDLYLKRKQLEEVLSNKTSSENILKESNKSSHEIIEHSPECICTLNKYGKVETINLAGVALLGTEKSENIVGMSLSKWIFPEDNVIFLDGLKNALICNETKFEIRIQTTKNEIHWISLTIARKMVENNFTSYICLIVDITDDKLTNKAESDSKAKLINRNKKLKKDTSILKRKNLDSEIKLKEMEETVKSNVSKVIKPMIKKLEKISPEYSRLIKSIESKVNNITQPLDDKFLEEFKNLSEKELEICTLLRKGLTVKDIAELKGVTESYISSCKNRIHKKISSY